MKERISQLILFFVGLIPNAGRTLIVKLLYLSDLEARRYLGRPITNLDYIWWDFGPFDSEILSQLDQLFRQGSLKKEHVCFPNAKAGYRYQLTEKSPPVALSKEERAIAEHVAREYGNLTLQNLLEEVVYKTKPMMDAKERESAGAQLRMELVDNEARVPGLELEKVLKAVEDLDQGRGRPFKEVLAKAHV